MRGGTDVRVQQRKMTAREIAALEPEHGPATYWQIKTQPGGGWVPWRPGRYLPCRWTAHVDGEELPYVARLSLTADEGGWRCEEISFETRPDGEPVSARLLRKMPVARLIESAVASASARGSESDGVLSITFGQGIGDATADFERAKSGRRARLSDEHLERVAEIYANASEKPVQAVWDAFDFVPSRTTCARWVERARKRGFLPPTTRGRGGTSVGKEH